MKPHHWNLTADGVRYACTQCGVFDDQRSRGTNCEAFACPRCKRVSHNPNDAANQYCGACKAFFDRILTPSGQFKSEINGEWYVPPRELLDEDASQVRGDGGQREDGDGG